MLFPGKKMHTFFWILIGLFLSLAWGELFTRILLPQNRDTVLDILEPDPVVGYVYRPGATIQERGRDYDVPFKINSIGLRDREIGERTAGRTRIMLVGNSFSVSHGVEIENSLSRTLERELNKLATPSADQLPVEVVNCANAGYNALNYWKAYSRWVPVLRPDVIAVGFVCAREHSCDTEETRYIVQDGLLKGRYTGDGPPPAVRTSPLMVVRKGLARNSDLYVLFRNYFFYSKQVEKLFGRETDGNTAVKDLRPYIEPLPAQVNEGWNLAFSHLERLHRQAADDGIQLVVMAIPEKSEVDDDHFSGLAANAGLDTASLNRDQPLRFLESFCRSRNIPVLSCFDAVAEAQRKQPAFFKFDNHWNSLGIAAASISLARQWQGSFLPPFGLRVDLGAGEVGGAPDSR